MVSATWPFGVVRMFKGVGVGSATMQTPEAATVGEMAVGCGAATGCGADPGGDAALAAAETAGGGAIDASAACVDGEVEDACPRNRKTAPIRITTTRAATISQGASEPMPGLAVGAGGALTGGAAGGGG